MKKVFFTNTPLVISLLISMAIATTEVPLWTSLFSLFMILWKFLNEKRDFPKLSPKITPILGLMVFVVVYIQHRTIFGQEESTTILLALTAITILNYETERDLLFLVLLGFLMVVLKSVFSLDFYWAAPAVFSFFGLWLCLISNRQVQRFRYLMSTLLRSLPLLFLLFVLFPRLVIFQTNKILNPIAQSGFTEELNPGRFSKVALSDQTVFRVEFLNIDNLQAKDLYWRGAVLYNSNGFVWHKGVTERKEVTFGKNTLRTPVRYKIVLEPLNLKNIFVLDTPVRIYGASEPVIEWNQGTYTLADTQQKLVQFEGESSFDQSEINRSDGLDKPKYLKISELPPRTKEWVEKTKEKFATPAARIEALNTFFQNPGFIYTLNPDQYLNDLDEFLFVKKRGFCEHFAAAYGTMARGLGIPSRVILGYQGGSFNSLGNFWKVSQKDAHAWVEVGLNNQWVRVDPTSFVSPLRVSLGAEEFFSLSEFEQLYFSKDKSWKKTLSFRSILTKAVSLFENLNYNWTLFLLNYDLQAQLEILKNVRGGWLYLVFGFIIVIYIVAALLKRRKKKLNQKHQLYDLFTRIESWAELRGFKNYPGLTPLQFLKSLAEKFPGSEALVHQFSCEYELIVYREKTSTTPISQWNRQWESFFKNLGKSAE